MTIQEAIQKAVEGGWKPFDKFKKKFELEDGYAVFNDGVNIRRRSFSDILLDPLFWQALGRVKYREQSYHYDTTEDYFAKKYAKEKMPEFGSHLASGKSIEDYFKSL